MGRVIKQAWLGAILLILSMVGCASMEPMRDRSGEGGIFKSTTRRNAATSAVNERGNQVADAALSFVGADTLAVDGKTFPYDCTGLVRAAYWSAGIDVAQDFGKYTGNGVTRIYKTLESKRLLHTSTIPTPGDLIFWDNTYDRNEDGRWNDPLTHVAVVVRAYEDGKIEYVHENYRKGIVVEYMNLRHPDTHTKNEAGTTVTVNSPMRMKGQVTRPLWLSGQLFREFGKAYLLR